MTCILALEQETRKIWFEDPHPYAPRCRTYSNIRAGEKYRLQDLLYSLMLESHNDSAVAVAEHIGGTVEGFAEMMNQKAKGHRMYRHMFHVTPNGLDGTTKSRRRTTLNNGGRFGENYALLRGTVSKKQGIS